MDVGNEVAKESRGDGQRPDDITFILPNLKVDNARPEAPTAAAAGFVELGATLGQDGHERLEDERR